MPGPYEAVKGRQRDLKGEDELQSYLEQAFGKSDVTSAKMRAAVRDWFDLYYGVPRAGEDTAPRVAALIVGKLCRTVFAEYETRLPPEAPDPLRRSLSALNAAAKTAMQTPAPYAAGTGSVPVALDRDAFARMGYRERLALKKENPEVYKELRK